MLHIVVAAEFRDGRNCFPGVAQLILCQSYAGINTVIHTGNAEGVFIDNLHIALAQVELPRHVRHAPGKLGAVVDGFAQVHQFMVMGRQRTRNFQGGFLQLGKKKLQELACYPLIMCAGKCIFQVSSWNRLWQ